MKIVEAGASKMCYVSVFMLLPSERKEEFNCVISLWTPSLPMQGYTVYQVFIFQSGLSEITFTFMLVG